MTLVRQLPFATSVALNETAADVKADEERSIKRTIDRPTPFTQRGMYQRRATKRFLTAIVGLKDIQAKYLRLPIMGGKRTAARGVIVPSNIKLNEYGNIKRGQLRRLLKRKDVFVARPGEKKTRHLAPGVYQRKRQGKGRGNKRTTLTQLVGFEQQAKYGKTYPFGKNAKAIVSREFGKNMRSALAKAMATAR